GIKSTNPISFQYFVNDETEEEDLAYVDTTLSDYGIDYEKAEVEIAYYQHDDWDRMMAIVTPKTYNKFAKLIGKEQIELKPNEVTTVEKSSSNIDYVSESENKLTIELQDGTAVKPSDFKKYVAEPDVLPIVYNYVIAGEDVISQLGEPENVEQHVAWQDKDADEEALISAG